MASSKPSGSSPTINIFDIFLDSEYRIDIDLLKAYFDYHNIEAWLKEHPYLTIHDIARTAEVCHKTIYTWRKRFNFKRSLKPPKPPRPEPKRAIMAKAPKNWDTSWLVAMYAHGFSTSQLAIATDRSVTAIKRRLRQFIDLRAPKDSIRSTHPCFNLYWVFDHYVRQGMSQNKCASLAGVSRYTFSGWLDFYKIRVRSSGEQTTINHVNSMGKKAC